MDHDVASDAAGVAAEPAGEATPEAAALARIAIAIDVLRDRGEALDAGRIAAMAAADPVVVDAYLQWISNVRESPSGDTDEAVILVRTEVYEAIRTTTRGGHMPTDHDTPAIAAEGGSPKPDPRNAKTIVADSIASVRKAVADPVAAETPAPAAGKRRRRGPYAECFADAVAAIDAVDAAERAGSGVAAAVEAAEAAMRRCVSAAKKRIAEARRAAEAL